MLTEEEMYALERLREGTQYEYRLDEHRRTLANAMLGLFPKGWNNQAHSNSSPPKELWFVTNEKGEFVTEEATSEQEAINWIDGPGNKDATLRVVKYVIAE